jgi:5-methylcytosine-specific restriction endonuclease McrA
MLENDIDLLPGLEARLIHKFKPPFNLSGIREEPSKIKTEIDHESVNLCELPEVKKWVAWERASAPRALIEYTYQKKSGSCSFCGDFINPKFCNIHPENAENPAIPRDPFNLFLLCRACNARMTRHPEERNPNKFKSNLIDVAIRHVSLAHSILSKYDYYSDTLADFIDKKNDITIRFAYERNDLD